MNIAEKRCVDGTRYYVATGEYSVAEVCKDTKDRVIVLVIPVEVCRSSKACEYACEFSAKEFVSSKSILCGEDFTEQEYAEIVALFDKFQ